MFLASDVIKCHFGAHTESQESSSLPVAKHFLRLCLTKIRLICPTTLVVWKFAASNGSVHADRFCYGLEGNSFKQERSCGQILQRFRK